MAAIPTVSLSPEDWALLYLAKELCTEVSTNVGGYTIVKGKTYTTSSVKFSIYDCSTTRRYFDITVSFNHCLYPNVKVVEIK
jgi:hypothetical protein